MSIRIRRKLPSALAVMALGCSLARLASADSDPYNEFRIGSETVFYHSSSTDVTGPFVPPDVNFHFKNFEAFYDAYVRKLSTHFYVELAGGYPPEVRTTGKGVANLGSVPYAGQLISRVSIFAPTLFVEYAFFEDSATFRPFVGVGVNYTNFYDRRSTAAGDAANGGPTKIELPSSIGPAAVAGLSYRIAPRWHAYASYSFVKVNTRLTSYTAGVERGSHIEFNPQVLVFSVGYSF